MDKPNPEPQTPAARPGAKHFFFGNYQRTAASAVAFCLVLGLAGFSLTKILAPHSNKPAGPPASVASCGAAKQLLTQSPIRLDQLSTIIPLGNFAPPGHVIPTEHMYYNYLNNPLPDGTPVPAKTTLYAPADMTVTRIVLFDNQSATKPFDSYRLDFSICGEVKGYFIHVLHVNDKLAAALTKPYDQTQTSDAGGGKIEHTYSKVVSVKLTAGEVFGSGGGGPGLPGGLDLGLYDSRIAGPTFANAARWTDDNKVVCSLDYYPADISKTLYAHIGDYNFKYIEPGEPKCGQVYQDLPGTAQGVWFGSDTPKNQLGAINGQLTLGHSNFNHRQATFAMGDAVRQIGLDPTAVYGFTPASSGQLNLDFSLLKPGVTTYCYQTANNTQQGVAGPAILLQLASDTLLHLGATSTTQCGAGPWAIAKSIDYAR